jgi:GntR family carbon starvation induced transcriptional regulator
MTDTDRTLTKPAKPARHPRATPPKASGAPLLDWATERLRNAIMSGELDPGVKLRAEELARDWGISSTPLREAFQRLAAEGLVTYSSQRGVRVAPVSYAEVNELYELRYHLEPWALERSIRHGDDAWRAEVQAAVATLDQWYADPDADLFDPACEVAHDAFHQTLLSRCDSEWLLRLVVLLHTTSMRYRHIGMSHGSTQEARTARDQHRSLARLAVTGAIDEAIGVQKAHLRLTHEAVAALLASEPTESPENGDE